MEPRNRFHEINSSSLPGGPVRQLGISKVYGGQEPRSNEVFVPARQATLAFGFHSLESIDGLHKRLELRAPRIMKSFWIRNELQGKKTTVMTTKKQFS